MALKESDKKAVAFLVVALLGGGIYMFGLPMYEDHQKRLLEIEDLVKELRVAHRKAENMSGLASEVDQLKIRLAELKKVLPTEASSFELIEKLQRLGADSGIKIKELTLEDRTERGEGWKSEGLKIQFSCYWYQFIEFLWRIENYERLIDVVSVSLNPEMLQPGMKLQNFNVVISANVYTSTLTEV